MSAPPVLVETPDTAVKLITLNRPEKRNALSVVLMDALEQAVSAASSDPRCRVVILRGNGPVFCAGLDLHEVADPANLGRSAETLARLYETLCETRLVTIAAVHGAAFGGGVGLLAACDLVVAADDLQIGFPEVRRGLVAALVAALLQRQLPERVLRELILLGRTLRAPEALAIGLVNRVVPLEQCLDAARALASEVIRGAPGAIARTKQLLDDLSVRPIRDALRRALRYHVDSGNAAEAVEGIGAFMQKREPSWVSGPR
jgi:methylglutaconyl-CoA hydratase